MSALAPKFEIFLHIRIFMQIFAYFIGLHSLIVHSNTISKKEKIEHRDRRLAIILIIKKFTYCFMSYIPPVAFKL